MKISLEYCHVTPGASDTGRVIADNNIWMPRIMKMLENDEIQKCIMIDDIHSNEPVTDKFINKLIDKLNIKPDCIYLESAFFSQAKQLVDNLDPEQRDIIHSGERTFIRENLEKFRSVIEFLVSWKKKNGEIKFSCPTLAAASYLYRLGLVKGEVKSIYGKEIKPANHCINMLWAKGLLIEDKSQSLIEASFSEALRKISWYLY